MLTESGRAAPQQPASPSPHVPQLVVPSPRKDDNEKKEKKEKKAGKEKKEKKEGKEKNEKKEKPLETKSPRREEKTALEVPLSNRGDRSERSDRDLAPAMTPRAYVP